MSEPPIDDLFGPDVPCPTRRPPEQWDALRAEAKAAAERLDRGATQLMAEGRAPFADWLRDAARILRALGA